MRQGYCAVRIGPSVLVEPGEASLLTLSHCRSILRAISYSSRFKKGSLAVSQVRSS